MVRKLIIEILSILEFIHKRSKEIEDDILKEFPKGFLVIPWGYEIESIRVAQK